MRKPFPPPPLTMPANANAAVLLGRMLLSKDFKIKAKWLVEKNSNHIVLHYRQEPGVIHGLIHQNTPRWYFGLVMFWSSHKIITFHKPVFNVENYIESEFRDTVFDFSGALHNAYWPTMPEHSHDQIVHYASQVWKHHRMSVMDCKLEAVEMGLVK